ncbi:unnamed protein product [Echinostoma caproni]|uniref:TPR_REGION domain-containing protein n=1 Tax=Echinostoma caproni TaxID=27848 RepID=A0A183B768_9TREM|nr:unnamed protein product [Echinostoma caproni]
MHMPPLVSGESDEPEAQTECTHAFEAAIQVDPTNPQAHLTAADYYTVIGNEQAARDSVQRCLDLWWSKLENFLTDSSTRKTDKETKQNSTSSVDAGGDGEDSATEKRDSIVKDEQIQLDMEEKCATLLEGLLEEDEDNVEIHYLLTEVGRHLWKEEDPQLLRYHALQTKIVSHILFYQITTFVF